MKNENKKNRNAVQKPKHMLIVANCLCMIRYTFCEQHMGSSFLYTNIGEVFATAPAAGI